MYFADPLELPQQLYYNPRNILSYLPTRASLRTKTVCIFHTEKKSFGDFVKIKCEESVTSGFTSCFIVRNTCLGRVCDKIIHSLELPPRL